MMNVWLTAKECVALPGLPGREHNIRHRLDKAAGGNNELRRRRQGSKAFEYHIDCLPESARAAVQQRHYESVLAQSDTTSTSVPAKCSTAIKPRQELELMRRADAPMPCACRA